MANDLQTVQLGHQVSVSCWNSLPADTASFHTISSLKNELKRKRRNSPAGPAVSPPLGSTHWRQWATFGPTSSRRNLSWSLDCFGADI